MAELEGLEKRVLRSDVWKRLTQSVTLPWILRFAALPEKAEVLELGSGGGFNAEVMLERFPGWRLMATDFDPEMVELCARRLARFGDRVDVRQADAAKLPLPDASFDIVISIFVWHHVEDWPRATAECARVLRPGGRLVLLDFVAAHLPAIVARLFPPMSRYRMRDVRAALREAGFARWRVDTLARLVYRLVAVSPSANGAQASDASKARSRTARLNDLRG